VLVSLSLLQPEPRPQKIDQLVIDGHVLPDQVLFTGPTSDNVPYRTLVFSDNLKVTVSFLHAHSKGETRLERSRRKNPRCVGDSDSMQGGEGFRAT